VVFLPGYSLIGVFAEGTGVYDFLKLLGSRVPSERGEK
jgi:hypothetical protein